MANSAAVKEHQRLRRERRAQQREARRVMLAFSLYAQEKPDEAGEYMSRADRTIAIERARARGEL